MQPHFDSLSALNPTSACAVQNLPSLDPRNHLSPEASFMSFGVGGGEGEFMMKITREASIPQGEISAEKMLKFGDPLSHTSTDVSERTNTPSIVEGGMSEDQDGEGSPVPSSVRLLPDRGNLETGISPLFASSINIEADLSDPKEGQKKHAKLPSPRSLLPAVNASATSFVSPRLTMPLDKTLSVPTSSLVTPDKNSTWTQDIVPITSSQQQQQLVSVPTTNPVVAPSIPAGSAAAAIALIASSASRMSRPSQFQRLTAFGSVLPNSIDVATSVSQSAPFVVSMPRTHQKTESLPTAGERKRKNWRWNRASTTLSTTTSRGSMQPHTRYRYKLNFCLEQLRGMSCPSMNDATQYDILTCAIKKLRDYETEIASLQSQLEMRQNESDRLTKRQKFSDNKTSTNSYAKSPTDDASSTEDFSMGKSQEQQSKASVVDIKSNATDEASDTNSTARSSGSASNSSTERSAKHNGGEVRSQSDSSTVISVATTDEMRTNGSDNRETYGSPDLYRTSQQHLKFFMNSEVPLFILDSHLNFVEVNERYAEQFRTSNSQMCKYSLLDFVPQSTLEATRIAFNSVLLTSDDVMQIENLSVICEGRAYACDCLIWCARETKADGTCVPMCIEGVEIKRTPLSL